MSKRIKLWNIHIKNKNQKKLRPYKCFNKEYDRHTLIKVVPPKPFHNLMTF